MDEHSRLARPRLARSAHTNTTSHVPLTRAGVYDASSSTAVVSRIAAVMRYHVSAHLATPSSQLMTRRTETRQRCYTIFLHKTLDGTDLIGK